MGKHTLLVVENDFDVRGMLRWLLEADGYEVKTAENGAAALRVLESCEPDLIISDLLMPLVVGEGLLKMLRRREGLAGTPILVLTTFPGAFGDCAVAAGATEVLKKSSAVPTLAEVVKRHLGRPAPTPLLSAPEPATSCGEAFPPPSSAPSSPPGMCSS